MENVDWYAPATIHDTVMTTYEYNIQSPENPISPRMKPFFDLEHAVLEEEIDTQDHVHNLRYLQWTLWAAGEHTKACGWDRASARESGFGWVVRSHDIKYRAPARRDDQIVVRTWISEIARYASRRKYVVCRPADQLVLCRVETRWVYVDLNAHTVVAVPPEVKAQMPLCETIPPLPWEPSND